MQAPEVPKYLIAGITLNDIITDRIPWYILSTNPFYSSPHESLPLFKLAVDEIFKVKAFLAIAKKSR